MTGSIQNKKRKLRKEIQKQREALLPEEVAERSLKISEHIYDMDLFQSAEIIHSYVPIAHKNEVDTSFIIQKIFELEKILVVPKMIAGTQLEHYQVQRMTDLLPNKWGVPEPVRGKPVAPGELDLIFIPMVAGDTFKNRLGYGKGFYDRFLMKTRAIKIGLLYHFQLFEMPIPTDIFDITLDMLVTDQTVVR